MRLNLISWLLLGFFAVAGTAMWITYPENGTGQIWVGCAAAGSLVFLALERIGRRAARLRETGIRAAAAAPRVPG